MNTGYKLILVACIIAGIAIYGSFFGVAGNPTSSRTTKTEQSVQADKRQPSSSQKDDEMAARACIRAERVVQERLKAPTTAQFPDCWRQEVRATPDRKTVFVKGYVDAQNSFGAMLRSHFVVQFKIEGDQWIVAAAAIQ